ELPWRDVQAAARPELPALLDLIDRELAAQAHSIGTSDTPGGARPQQQEAAPAARGETAPPSRPPRSSWWPAAAVAAVVSLVIALGAYAGGWLLNTRGDSWDPSRHQMVLDRLDALDKRLQVVEGGSQSADNLKGDIADARNRISALESAQKAPGAAPDLTPLTKRVDALQQKIAALEGKPSTPSSQSAGTAPTADTAGLNERIAALESKLAALPNQPAAAVDPAAIDKLNSENAALRSDVAALKARLAAVDQALSAHGRDANGVAFALAVGNLGGALSTARPFA